MIHEADALIAAIDSGHVAGKSPASSPSKPEKKQRSSEGTLARARNTGKEEIIRSADGAENPITGDWKDGSDDTSDDGSDDGTSAWRNRRRSQLDDPEVAHAAAEATRLALSDSDSQESFSPDPPIQTATAASTNFENTQSAQGRQESEFDAMFSDDSESDDDASWTPAASSTPAQPSSGAVVPLVVVNENSSEEDEFSGGEGGFEDQARPQQQQGPLSRQGSHYGFDGTNAIGDASRERKRSYNEHHQRRLEKQASSTSIGSDFGGFDSTASPQHDPEASPQEFHLPCRWTDAGFLLRNDGRKTTVGHVDEGGPAELAGLPSGAHITTINGVDIQNLPYADVMKLVEDFDSLNLTAIVHEGGFGFLNVPNRLRSESCSGFTFVGGQTDHDSSTVDETENDNNPRTVRKGSVYNGFAAVERLRARRKQESAAAAAVDGSSDDGSEDYLEVDDVPGNTIDHDANFDRTPVHSRQPELDVPNEEDLSGFADGGKLDSRSRSVMKLPNSPRKPSQQVRFEVGGFVEIPGVMIEGRPIQRSRVKTPPLEAENSGDVAVVVLSAFLNEGKITVNQYSRIVMMLEEEADDPLVVGVRRQLATPEAPSDSLFELVKVLVSATESLAEIV